MKKEIKTAHKTQTCFNISKSEGKLPKASTSTIYSLLDGKRIKTDAEVYETIKNKRAKSYQKLSFSIRKMDYLYKADYKKGEGSSPNKSEKVSEDF